MTTRCPRVRQCCSARRGGVWRLREYILPRRLRGSSRNSSRARDDVEDWARRVDQLIERGLGARLRGISIIGQRKARNASRRAARAEVSKRRGAQARQVGSNVGRSSGARQHPSKIRSRVSMRTASGHVGAESGGDAGAAFSIDGSAHGPSAEELLRYWINRTGFRGMSGRCRGTTQPGNG